MGICYYGCGAKCSSFEAWIESVASMAILGVVLMQTVSYRAKTPHNK